MALFCSSRLAKSNSLVEEEALQYLHRPYQSQMQQQCRLEAGSEVDVICAAAGRSSAGARGAKVFRSKHSRLGPVAERGPAVRLCFGSMCSSQLCKALPMHVSHDGVSWRG